MLKRICALLTGIVVCINLAWIQPVAGAIDYSIMRVALSSMGTPNSVTLKVDGQFSIPDIGNDLLEPGDYRISVEGGQLILYFKTTSRAMGSRFTFKNQDNYPPNYLRVLNTSYGWANYLGNMEVRLVNGAVQLINHIHVETYLYGVVPYEMSNGWPIEALKAQAIAARTYAARCKNPSSYFDVYDTETSQVYRGYDLSKQNAIRAVDETFGMVLKYGDEYAGTFYSSSNGGKTEAASNLWSQYLPYLLVQDDPYDIQNPSNPNAFWTVEYSRTTVEPALQARLKARLQSSLEARGMSGDEQDINILQIKDLVFDPPNESGRMRRGQMILMVDVKSKSDSTIYTIEETIDLTQSNIRSIFSIKSLLFTVETLDDIYIIRGGGYGHGVGMSQFGAHEMAQQGLSFAHILGFYYPGTRIESLGILPPDRGGERPDPTPDPGPKEEEKPKEEDPDINAKTYAKVNVSTTLNIRQGPGQQYQKIGSLSAGARVEVLEQSGGWHKVKAGDLVGYVHSDYILIEETSPNPPPKEPGQGQKPDDKPKDPVLPPPERRYTAIVVASALNIRSGPSTRNHKVGMVIQGTRLTILEQEAEWYKIAVNGLEGYVHGEYIKLEQEATQETPSNAIVIASTLNVRSGSSTGSSKIDTLSRNSQVRLLEKQGSWYKVEYSGKTGFVHGDYLQIQSNPSNPDKGVAERIGTVNASTLNVRNGAGTQYSRINTLPRGVKVTIIEESAGWYKIQSGSIAGYVSKEYIKL